MKKTGSNVISFPKPRRTEQNGLTQKSFPARWLGVLLLTTMGAAWAISPGGDRDGRGVPTIDSVVFEGEPQVVAQLMGTVVGPEQTPGPELKALSALGGSERRVVVAQKKVDSKDDSTDWDAAAFCRTVEEVESEYSESGAYPAIPASKSSLQGVGYRTSGQAFKLESASIAYDSSEGIKVAGEKNEESGDFAISGHLSQVSEGWGPWRSERTDFAKNGRPTVSNLDWLAEAPVTPAWSARMYFPVDREHTGYAFRAEGGKTSFSSGEVLYDAVSGTFQLKLRRKKRAVGRSFSAQLLEERLSGRQEGCEWVGDSDFLAELGFAKKSGEESLIQVSSPNRLMLSADDALDGLALASFARHKKTLIAGKYVAGEDKSERKVAAVGRLSLVDKMGQIHQVRVRAGRAENYDWVVGQLCPVAEPQDDVAVSKAYSNAFGHKTERTIIAGK